MIRPCTSADIPQMDAIINEAAEKYRGVIPADCWHEPYMSRRELESEIAAGVRFSGWEEAGELVGVMGVQTRQRRHVDPSRLRSHRATGPRDRRQVADRAVKRGAGPLLIGTWADASWAIRFYQGHGFQLMPAEEKNRLLGIYWRFRIGSATPRWCWRGTRRGTSPIIGIHGLRR